ncbi:hypothetical protein HAZT_HAZT009431 [Hyalella azteca]|uniref:Uncharacterized protein n=1 Tax=Hyalella azteca TaxID=294128 RepID=A0A6A0HFV2_HYAAZ|nr:hypothetical protein HAZT_HAZT009431 [Hyalella azteca]
MPTELALVYDAVQLFARALSDLDKTRAIEVLPLNCSKEQVWPLGATLVNYIKWVSQVLPLNCSKEQVWPLVATLVNYIKWVELYGFSGLVRFNACFNVEYGARSDVKLDVVALTEGGLRVIGRWDPIGGANFTLPGDSAARRAVKSMRNSQLKILSILGISVDLAREISRLLGFNYTFNPALDEYGEFNPTQQRWTGLIGEIVEKRADMIIADLPITSDRQRAVDFSSPWMSYGLSALYRPDAPASPYTLLLSPLSLELWLATAITYALLALIYAYINRQVMCTSDVEARGTSVH